MDTSAPDRNDHWIRILLHARAAEMNGENEVHIRTSPAATVRDLKSAIALQVPKLAGILASSAIATDTDYLSDSALLGDETSLHLIPPVSGG
ncbi:MAG TPA: MoaD/ThiS family protein [bacterium]|nr:MoaD/ThiS family protein [bacterium]